jgi:2-polyprenyl-6-methoxyphenol hydroxylase-like FAD-dependent oxidoreductase
MANETALISGAGIAGPTLSYWLARTGWKPTIVESAPSVRTDGYVIDFWGLGYDIADRMELCGDLDRLGYHMREMRIVDDEGRRKTGFGTNVFREIAGGRFPQSGVVIWRACCWKRQSRPPKSFSTSR